MAKQGFEKYSTMTTELPHGIYLYKGAKDAKALDQEIEMIAKSVGATVTVMVVTAQGLVNDDLAIQASKLLHRLINQVPSPNEYAAEKAALEQLAKHGTARKP